MGTECLARVTRRRSVVVQELLTIQGEYIPPVFSGVQSLAFFVVVYCLSCDRSVVDRSVVDRSVVDRSVVDRSVVDRSVIFSGFLH